ncbi:hypothetical protein [Acuticoccus sp. I52.16.1]|uniref:hypothetical protein n=1 Tax=Acuticoccus sp. I52.16.1 TaxID=2928472 RepID=UPI001FD58FA0|nr:hypothetical protein [Acuticoccus sp. I52.16.1]UOM34896.1 hypothetical protein MRB58_01400 [Acuticoccus sp. I52.16.1]
MRTILLSLVLGLLAASGAANAQTIGYADAIAILTKQCGSDVAKYCSKASLANDGITNCLAQNQDKISNACATTVVQVVQSLDAREAAEAAAPKVCATDARRLCKLTKGGQGHLLQCLLKAEPSVSAQCNAAITNAGWR